MAPRAKLKLSGVTTRQQVSEDMDAVSWCILSNGDAAEILKDTEVQVLETLVIIFWLITINNKKKPPFFNKKAKFQNTINCINPLFYFFDI